MVIEMQGTIKRHAYKQQQFNVKQIQGTFKTHCAHNKEGARSLPQVLRCLYILS